MIESPPRFKYDEKVYTLFTQLRDNGELKEINDAYLYWDKIKYKVKIASSEEYWSAIKTARTLNAQIITFGKTEFQFVITDYIQQLLHYFDLNIGGNLGSNVGIAERDKTKFMISSIMEEAISSSQMEGANTTRKKAKEMIQKELKPKSKSEQMIMNNFVTMKHIVQHKSDDLTPEKLLYIHNLISHNTLDNKQEEGIFRENNDIYVVNYSNSEVVHTPPNHKEIEGLINELCDFFNNDQKTFIHLVMEMVEQHVLYFIGICSKKDIG
jgi:hypothetical protein